MSTKISKNGIRAFSDSNYDYYRLTKPFGVLPMGTVFVHDPDDDETGSPMEGCLKLCWTPSGDCYGGICGNTVILHYNFSRTDWFEKVSSKTKKPDIKEIIKALKEIVKDLEE